MQEKNYKYLNSKNICPNILHTEVDTEGITIALLH